MKEILELIKSDNQEDIILGLRMLGTDFNKNIKFFKENLKYDDIDNWFHLNTEVEDLIILITNEIFYSIGSGYLIVGNYSLDKYKNKFFSYQSMKEAFNDEILDFRL